MITSRPEYRQTTSLWLPTPTVPSLTKAVVPPAPPAKPATLVSATPFPPSDLARLDEIAELAAHIHDDHPRLLVLIRDFDRTRGLGLPAPTLELAHRHRAWDRPARRSVSVHSNICRLSGMMKAENCHTPRQSADARLGRKRSSLRTVTTCSNVERLVRGWTVARERHHGIPGRGHVCDPRTAGWRWEVRRALDHGEALADGRSTDSEEAVLKRGTGRMGRADSVCSPTSFEWAEESGDAIGRADRFQVVVHVDASRSRRCWSRRRGSGSSRGRGRRRGRSRRRSRRHPRRSWAAPCSKGPYASRGTSRRSPVTSRVIMDARFMSAELGPYHRHRRALDYRDRGCRFPLQQPLL